MDAREAIRLHTPLSASSAHVVQEPFLLAADDIADGIGAIRATYARDTPTAGVCVVDGMGLRLLVDRGALVVADGMGGYRRERRFDKATHGLRRVVVLGSTGSLTLDALHWCSRLGIGVVVVAPDGSARLASTPRVTDDARLRRTQALAASQPVGLDIARYLLADKVRGQAQVVAKRFGELSEAETIEELAHAIECTESIEEARQLEASAAALSFAVWTGRPETAPTFVAKDRPRVPAHWSTYEGRRSVLAGVSANR